MSKLQITYDRSPIGITKIIGNAHGIQSISLLDSIDSMEQETPEEELAECLHKAKKQLQEYFEGNRTEFDLKLAPQGTAFQQKVWSALLRIPFSATTSYAEQSSNLGNIKAIRAVAAANGKNPIAIVIPCHRVIGSDGSLTGYAGGLWRKKWLLAHENPFKQQSLF